MKVVIDSSVLIGLTSIDKLDLITEVLRVEEVSIPPAVWREVVDEGQGRKGAKEVQAAEWISTEKVDDRSKVNYPAPRYGACRKTSLTTDFVLLQKKTQHSNEMCNLVQVL